MAFPDLQIFCEDSIILEKNDSIEHWQPLGSKTHIWKVCLNIEAMCCVTVVPKTHFWFLFAYPLSIALGYKINHDRHARALVVPTMGDLSLILNILDSYPTT